MKIEVNLHDVFAGEDGASVNDAIKDAVISSIVAEFKSTAGRSLQEQLDKAITKEIGQQVESTLSAIMPNLLDYQFTEVTGWGEKKETWTVRNRILEALRRHCTYEKKNWDSEKTAFTKALESVVETKMAEHKKAFNKLVDEKFTAEAMAYAERSLRERLKVRE